MSSFSESIKEELLKTFPEKPCCMLSELSAFTRNHGSLVLRGGGGLAVRYQLRSTALAKRLMVLLKRRMRIVPQILFREEKAFGAHRAVILQVQEADTRRLLTSLKMLRADGQGVMLQRMPRNTLSRRCCQRAYIRAMFLSCGSFRDPSGGYTIEFTLPDEEKTQALKSMLENQGIACRLRGRKSRYVLYASNGDAAADLLTLMGAPVSRLSFEDQRILRSSSARATRAMNCDNANIGRQVQNAEAQRKALRAFLKEHALEELPDSLAETARLRIRYPSASLEELAGYFSPPLTKSGANHRLKKLMERIGGENGGNGS